MTLLGDRLDTPVAVPPPGRRRTSILIGSVVVLIVVTLGVSALGLRRALDGVEHDVATLQDELRANAGADRELRDRVGSLEDAATGEFDPAAVAAAAGPSVFMIVAPYDDASASLGTGFVLGKVGHHSLVVTNYHVVEDRWRTGSNDVVLMRGTREYTGEIVEVRPAEDLAVVDVAADLPTLAPATSVQIGDPVLVVGAGEGLEGTVTTGVVSAIDRLLDGRKWLQISAQVNPGNSGGPVLDAAGNVLGVVTSKHVALELEGLSFAIPVDDVCASLDVC